MKNNRDLFQKIFKDKSWLTISNFLTLSRILLTPVIVVGIFYEKWLIVFLLIIFVGITDLLDGYLARLLNEGTMLGKLLDPIADKFLIISSFSALAFLRSPSFFIPTWFVIFVLFREFIILFGVYLILRIGKKLEIAPIIWGKLTTLFQVLFILWLFVCYFFNWVPAKTYYFLLISLTLFSFLSLFYYIKIGIQSMRGNLGN